MSTDSGTSVTAPHVGNEKLVGGQRQSPVEGTTNLTTKKGTISFFFSDVSVQFKNINQKALGTFGVEYGAWQIRSGSGIYKSWKGGGRWANASTPSVNNVEWDGDVTH